MPSRHLSIRIDPASLERLDRESRRMRMSRSEAARTLLEEGLRMEEHPGIVFRAGPAGRRAGIVGGPDVWEIARVYRDVDGPNRLTRTVELTGFLEHQIRVAGSYYAEFQDEIDDWIAMVDEEAERAEAAWLAVGSGSSLGEISPR
jgi:hypothetical protein